MKAFSQCPSCTYLSVKRKALPYNNAVTLRFFNAGTKMEEVSSE